MTAEGGKIQQREEMIKGLESDKLRLEQEVVHLKELLALKADNHIDKGKQAAGQQLQSVAKLYLRLVGWLDA